MTPEFVSEVKQLLPLQPWPTGIHKQIATELATTRGQKAIKVLIQAGSSKIRLMESLWTNKGSKLFRKLAPNLRKAKSSNRNS